MSENEQGYTVDPATGLRVLEAARPQIYKEFEGQGDSPASAVSTALVGYYNALAEIDHLRDRLAAIEQKTRRQQESYIVRRGFTDIDPVARSCYQGFVNELDDLLRFIDDGLTQD